MNRKRFAIVGTGGRAAMFVDAICGTYRETNELVALCDLSQTRMDWHNRRIRDEHGLEPVPTYHAAPGGHPFDRMVKETKPDTIIVTTVDATHHEYIVRAMDLGCDAITEKPMTTDVEKARAIIDAIERTGRSLRVTFNYRYAPLATRVRELLMNGAVGNPLHVDFSWVLDTWHGADYFRRWHREKDQSGGLLVHKATHHFDLINWWIQSFPSQVFALGDLIFYGRANAEKRGEIYEYDRYTGVPAAEGDPFARRLDEDEALRGLYLEAEAESGYIRDRNVFGDDITVEDTMSVTARYRNGALLTYSLIAYAPWEGYRCAITGDRGRLEVEVVEATARTTSPHEDPAPVVEGSEPLCFAGEHIWVFPMHGAPYNVPVPAGEGDHGGADPLMLEQIFSPTPPPDPFDRAASHVDGAASILLGIAANRSIATGQMVSVDELLPLP